MACTLASRTRPLSLMSTVSTGFALIARASSDSKSVAVRSQLQLFPQRQRLELQSSRGRNASHAPQVLNPGTIDGAATRHISCHLNLYWPSVSKSFAHHPLKPLRLLSTFLLALDRTERTYHTGRVTETPSRCCPLGGGGGGGGAETRQLGLLPVEGWSNSFCVDTLPPLLVRYGAACMRQAMRRAGIRAAVRILGNLFQCDNAGASSRPAIRNRHHARTVRQASCFPG